MIRMGRGNRDEPTTPAYEPQPATEPYRYASEPTPMASRGAISESDSMARDIKEGRLSGFVGHGTTLTGETEFHAMLRVDGHLVGTVTSEAGTLIVGTSGIVDANIAVAAATINGAVNGDIVATEKLHLGRTARVLGNIQSPRLIVEEGAILEGSCTMVQARQTQEEDDARPEEEAYSDPEPAQSSLISMSDDDYLPEDDEESADAATV
jgi:cytoskeletal protein CcmA (bactofilin family)